VKLGATILPLPTLSPEGEKATGTLSDTTRSSYVPIMAPTHLAPIRALSRPQRRAGGGRRAVTFVNFRAPRQPGASERLG
jgi:hypothetical protein